MTSSTLSTAGSRRGSRTTVSRRARSGRSSVTMKKKRRAATALLMLGGRTPVCAWWCWKRRRSSAVAVAGDRPIKAAKAHVANVIAARLLAEAAHPHVFDHARPQRADGPDGRMGGHRGILSRAEGCWTFHARDPMPRSSRLTAYPAPKAPTATRAPIPRERVRSRVDSRPSLIPRRTASRADSGHSSDCLGAPGFGLQCFPSTDTDYWKEPRGSQSNEEIFQSGVG